MLLSFIRHRSPILLLAQLFTGCALVTNLATDIEAQSSAHERANALRGQLVDIQTKRESLETRLRHLDEELRPENIEKSLAGIGSTRPDDLRELRRRQLELEKTNIQTQLKLLTDSQRDSKLESFRQTLTPIIKAQSRTLSVLSTRRRAHQVRVFARDKLETSQNGDIYRLTQD